MSSKKKNFRQRRTSSTSEEEVEQTIEITEETGEVVKVNKLDRIEELKFAQKLRERKHGIDVYSLAIGEKDTNKSSNKKDQIDVSYKH